MLYDKRKCMRREYDEKQKGKVTIIVAIIGAISTIAAACISGYFNYKAGADKTEKEIDNKIVQETQIVVDGSDNAVDYLIEENKKLEVDLEEKEAEISKLKTKMNSFKFHWISLKNKICRIMLAMKKKLRIKLKLKVIAC